MLDQQANRSKPKVSYYSWTTGDNELALEAAVDAVLAGEDSTLAAQKIVPSILIPRQTLDRAVKKETERQNDALDETNESDDDGLFDRQAKTDAKSLTLTTPEFRTKMQQAIICARDELNNGITRMEVITMIADFHTVTHKKAEDHYDYMIRKKMLPALLRGGRTVVAQATTTN